MRSIFLLILTLLSSLLSSVVTAAVEPADALQKSRSAAIQLNIRQGHDLTNFSRGVFVSEEGHALVSLDGVCREQVPRTLSVGGVELKLGDILGLFPEHGLALVKYDHRPKAWLKFAEDEPEIGDSISFITLKPDAPWAKVVPPIVGPVMAKRSELADGLRMPQFVKVLSIGSGVTWAQRASLVSGSFAVDLDGDLVAFLKGTSFESGQLLVTLAPIIELADHVEELKETGKIIPHPLPDAHNPLDMAMQSEEYAEMGVAMNRLDRDSVRLAYENLREKYPSSLALKLLQFDPNFSDPATAKQSASLENIEEANAEEPKALQIKTLIARAMFLIAREDFEGAIRDLKAAIALSPRDYPDPRESLAFLYAQLGRLDDAKALYREALEGRPEDIGLNERFESLLTKKRDWDDLEIIEERLDRLREIYRR